MTGGGLVVLLPRVVGLFAVAGLALAAVRHRPDIATLTARLRTWAVIAVVWFGALALGRPGVVTLALACGAIAGAEYGRLALPARTAGAPDPQAVIDPSRALRIVLVVAGGGLPLLTLLGGRAWLIGLAVALLTATVPPLLAQDTERGFDALARTCLGIVWIAAACSTVAVLPLALLPLVGLATATADIGGFVGGAIGGRHGGSHRLAARLSPGKTVEGVVGSAVLASVGTAICADVAGLPWPLVPVVGAAVALACTWGDLLESLLKRSAGRKDAGGWLPGFGGLLDRIDSLLVVAPLTWLLVTLTTS